MGTVPGSADSGNSALYVVPDSAGSEIRRASAAPQIRAAHVLGRKPLLELKQSGQIILQGRPRGAEHYMLWHRSQPDSFTDSPIHQFTNLSNFTISDME